MRSIFFNKDVLTAEKEIIKKTSVSTLLLMENAGLNAAKIIYEEYHKNNCDKIILLTGKGNNTGDGFVIIRHLDIFFSANNIKKKFFIYPFYKPEELKGDAGLNASLVLNSSHIDYEIINEDLLKSFFNDKKVLIIDAIFGVGFTGKLDEKITDTFKHLNNIPDKFIIAVDIPSGLNNYNDNCNCLKSDITISMGVHKFETLFYYGKSISGKIILADIGINSEYFSDVNDKRIYFIDSSVEELFLQRRNPSGHKYTNGKSFILGGNLNYSGAMHLASLAALKAGSGSVIAGVPDKVKSVLDVTIPEVISIGLCKSDFISREKTEIIFEKIEWADSILIGPGIGRETETLTLIRECIKKYPEKNFIIDADGLYAFKGHLDIFHNRKVIITPHMGEFAALIDEDLENVKNNFFDIADKFVKKYKIVLVLKNSPSIVFSEKGCFINSAGKENLGTIGSGDVLSGIICALLSQTKNPDNAAITGTFLHSRCGDLLYELYDGNPIRAGEIIDMLPVGMKKIKKKSFDEK